MCYAPILSVIVEQPTATLQAMTSTPDVLRALIRSPLTAPPVKFRAGWLKPIDQVRAGLALSVPTRTPAPVVVSPAVPW